MSESVVIITGSAKGLGKGFAQTLLKRGCFVALSDVSEEDGHQTLKEFQEVFGKDKVIFVQCDVRSKDDFERLWKETQRIFGKNVNVLVNNAGVNGNHASCLDINLYGVMNGVEIAHKEMQSAGSGLIINIGSMAGLVPNYKIMGNNYFVSKRGVVTLTRALGVASKNSGIKSSVLCPFFVDTDLANTPDIKKEVSRLGGQILSVERVVEAFDLLYENADVYNGKALVVTTDSPFFTMPIYNWNFIVWLVLGANFMKKLVPKMEVYSPGYQAFFILMNIGIFAFFFEIIIFLIKCFLL
uniref:15-hydroxyprostaglandin dehydrogenase [NAD(+)] n=1 Tax=Lepeophtheirus salmonis TaxID=72036 RepID=D3PJV4_LEPSM|nr:15-hydroxyprostaglandin dehydrogenase [Lepeophtheirus salmonis]